MQSVKAELLQVQKLVGVHQPKDEGSTPQPSTREADVCEFRLGREGGPSMTGAGPSMAVGQSPEPDPWQVDLL
eukprot:g4465.t1